VILYGKRRQGQDAEMVCRVAGPCGEVRSQATRESEAIRHDAEKATRRVGQEWRWRRQTGRCGGSNNTSSGSVESLCNEYEDLFESMPGLAIKSGPERMEKMISYAREKIPGNYDAKALVKLADKGG
jgi:hypothetical protein